MRSPGERLRAGARDRVVLEAELGQQRARLLLRQLALRDEGVEQRGGAVEAEPRLVERADAHAGADPARARGERQPADERVDERRLAAAVRADERDPLAPGQLEVERAEHEAAAPQRRAVQAHGHVARALAAAEAQLQLPAPPRLVDGVEPLDRLLRRAHLRRLLLGALGPLGAADLVRVVAAEALAARTPVSDHWRWRPRAVGEPVALGRVGRRSAPRRGARRSPAARGSRPSRRRTPRGVGDLVELEHARDRALEEGAVVRDDHRAAGPLGDEPLQPRQAVEVEVVGRLVEQQDVEAREQDRGERRARGLAAGERRGLQVEQRGIQPEVAQDRLRARLEVGAAEREPRLERVGVAVRGARRVAPPASCVAACTRASAAATPVRRAR